MAIRIVSPRSTIIDIPEPEILVQWEDSTGGQEAYELQYKLKKADVWSTCGKIYDADARSTSLNTIYNFVGVDFYEIHYRIVIYYNGPNDKGSVKGIETSDAYSIIFRHGIANTLKLYDGLNINEYPLYDQVSIDKGISGNEVEVIKISLDNTGSTINKLPLVEDDSAIKSDINIFISDTDTKKVAGSYAVFTDTGIYGETYMNQNTYYQVTVYDYTYQDVYNSYPLYMPVEYYNYREDYTYKNVYYNSPIYDYNWIVEYREETAYGDRYNFEPVYADWIVYRYGRGNEYYLVYDYSSSYRSMDLYGEESVYKSYISSYNTGQKYYPYNRQERYNTYGTYTSFFYYNQTSPLTYGSDYKYAGYYYYSIIGYYWETYDKLLYYYYDRSSRYNVPEYEFTIYDVPVYGRTPAMSQYYYATSFYTYRDKQEIVLPYYSDYKYYTDYYLYYYDYPIYRYMFDYSYRYYAGRSYSKYYYSYWTGDYAYWYTYYFPYYDYSYRYRPGYRYYWDGYYTYYYYSSYIDHYYDYISSYVPIYDYNYLYMYYSPYVEGYNYIISGYDYYYDYTYTYAYVVYQYIYNYYYFYYNS